MRLVVGMLICMGTGAISVADTPPPPPAEPAASSVPAAPAPAAAPAATQPTTAAAGASHEPVDPREKSLKAKGYHVEMHNGEKTFCRTDQVLGSRLPGQKSCGTLEQLQEREHLSKEFTGDAQRLQLNPTGK